MTQPTNTDDELDKQLLRVRQAYTEAHTRLGGSRESTVEDILALEMEIIGEVKEALIAYIERQVQEALNKERAKNG